MQPIKDLGNFLKNLDANIRISLLSCFCGLTIGIGACLILKHGIFCPPGFYLVLFGGFHYLEYLITAIHQPKRLSPDSFLLNHGVAYYMATALCWIEYAVEANYAPALKSGIGWVSLVGVLLALAGQTLRSMAMWQCSSNFSHFIQEVKEEAHVLVRHGVYAFSRHPSYLGWFLWVMGMQLVLVNPVCLVVFAVVTWRFFSERIDHEEALLLHFFGKEYANYAKATPTRIPFLRGMH